MKNLFYFFCVSFLKNQLAKKIFASLTLLFLLLPQYACNTTEPASNQTLTLKLEDISCTEAWIQFSSINIQIPDNITLYINDQPKKSINLTTADTLLYIDSLLPNQTYKLKVSGIQNQESSILSNELTFTTMDTTNHNLTWQTFTFGVITNQSHLFDVAIINENDIWAVGEIYAIDSYTYDSLGNWIDPYNAAHWNGNKWELIRIYYNYNGSDLWSPIRTIFAFNANDIWFGAGIHWNGIDFIKRPMNIDFPYQINKMWGTASNDLYIVGNGGSIAHYGGPSVGWKKIESGTSLFLSDIAVNNLGEVFICGGNPSFGQGILLKSTNENNFSTFVDGANIPESQLFNPKLYGSFSSIWFDQNNTLYSGGNILFQNKFNNWSYVKSLPENFIGGNPGVYYRGYITRVRGNASNDMWIVGDRNTLRHFNGVTWQQIGMPYDPQIDLVWRGMACKDNNTVIVGSYNRSAIIMMIKK